MKNDGLQGLKDFKISIDGTTKIPTSVSTSIKTINTFSKTGYSPVKLSTVITPANSNILSINNGVVIPTNVGTTNIVIKDSIKQRALKTIKGTVTGLSPKKPNYTGVEEINGISYIFKNGKMVGKKSGWVNNNGKYSYSKMVKSL